MILCNMHTTICQDEVYINGLKVETIRENYKRIDNFGINGIHMTIINYKRVGNPV